MKLQSDRELENTRRKLSGLQELMRKKEQATSRSDTYDLSLTSMKKLEKQLLAEIDEYERAHQTT